MDHDEDGKMSLSTVRQWSNKQPHGFLSIADMRWLDIGRNAIGVRKCELNYHNENHRKHAARILCIRVTGNVH